MMHRTQKTSTPPSTTTNSKHYKLFFISMATIFSLALFSLISYLSLSSAARHFHQQPRPAATAAADSPTIQQACKATRYPQQCESSLLQSKQLPPDPNPNPVQIIQTGLGLSTQNLETARSMVQAILDNSGSDHNRSVAARSCLEYIRNSNYRISSTVNAIPRGRIKDARAWVSAGLEYQYNCFNTLLYVNGTKQVSDTMSFFNSLIGLTSNALSMIVSYDNFGNQTASWVPPQTERDGFWESVSSGSDFGFKSGFPIGLKPDVIVCKQGGDGCQYNTVQDAVNAAPSEAGSGRFVILIKSGVYEEIVRVPLEKKNVVFLGEGMGKTVITGSLSMPTTPTYLSATVGILGDGFMAKDLTIQNTAGAGTQSYQALAFRSDSDFSYIENCEFLGNQDTVYAKSLRQFYKSCRIVGNVDFIFGNSASIFEGCTILIRPRQLNPEKGEKNTLTAHGRTDPAQSSGFVFHNCLINGTEEYMQLYYKNPKVHLNYLGRPWKEYSRTVFVGCTLETLISPDGWLPWNGDFALKTLYYGEFQNTGPGANLSGRVTWSSQIPAEHVNSYSVQNFIQGNEWVPTSD